MSNEDQFKIISVTGAHSKVGKTTLCSILLKNLKDFGAIKFTKTSFYTSVVDDIETITQKDKDTAIMYESGAKKVVWIQSHGNELSDALTLAMSKIIGLEGVVVEGNSPVDFLTPNLTIFIIGKDGHIKPSATKVSKKSDIIIINAEKQTENLPFLAALKENNQEVFWINLLEEQGEIDKFLDHVKKYI